MTFKMKNKVTIKYTLYIVITIIALFAIALFFRRVTPLLICIIPYLLFEMLGNFSYRITVKNDCIEEVRNFKLRRIEKVHIGPVYIDKSENNRDVLIVENRVLGENFAEVFVSDINEFNTLLRLSKEMENIDSRPTAFIESKRNGFTNRNGQANLLTYGKITFVVLCFIAVFQVLGILKWILNL